jgi:hypothetical protein
MIETSGIVGIGTDAPVSVVGGGGLHVWRNVSASVFYGSGLGLTDIDSGPQGETGAQGTQGSTGAQGTLGTQGTTGAQGTIGTTGLEGRHPGVRWRYETNTTPPTSAGYFRANSGTWASITSIWIDDDSYDAIDMQA